MKFLVISFFTFQNEPFLVLNLFIPPKLHMDMLRGYASHTHIACAYNVNTYIHIYKYIIALF